MFGVYTLVVLCLLSLSRTAVSSPCIAFDINDNLLAFGLAGKDWNAGTQDNWSSSSGATDITTNGRPPFDGEDTTCYLAQYFNAIYVLNGSKSNPTSIYIYDATAKSWSTQSVTTAGLDTTSFNAVLDHDTNLFYALSHGEMYSLDMGTMKSASGSTISWKDLEKVPFDTNGYEPVMALAQNHIHFLGVSSVPVGDALIYVIHYNFFQPDTQAYPSSNGASFPAVHGQATSFFQDSGVQQEFAFISDDFSGTYVINVESNTTQILAPPSSKDASAIYFAGITSLVQLDSAGAVSYLPYKEGDDSTNAAATWSSVKPITIAAPPNSVKLEPSSSSHTSSGSGPSVTGGSTTGGQATNGAAQGCRSARVLVAMFCLVAARLL